MKEAAYHERLKRGLSIGRAARILGVPTVTLRVWMNQGKVPGVHRTEGGHRWVTREGLHVFARARGLGVSDEKRRHGRTQAHKLRIRVWAESSGEVVVQGEGRLRDLSLDGFRTDRIRWRTPYTPALGTRIRFEVPVGRLGGVSGSARVAWHVDNRRERGAALGARILILKGRKSAWQAYAGEETNG